MNEFKIHTQVENITEDYFTRKGPHPEIYQSDDEFLIVNKDEIDGKKLNIFSYIPKRLLRDILDGKIK